MADEEESGMKTSTSLQQILGYIAQERSKDNNQNSVEDGGFIVLNTGDPNDFWIQLFSRYFLNSSSSDDSRDDMLFYVRKQPGEGRFPIPKTEIEVYRRDSKKLPQPSETNIDWEETVYLNLILQHFEYHITCAVCTRTGEKELQILKKFTQTVYASPSRRQMDSKGTAEQITYPSIFFMVDNFEEAFADIIVRDSEMVCVELVAYDRQGTLQGVIFLGSIRYDALKKVYDARASLTSRMAQRMSIGWFHGHKRVEFMRMRGPQGKGHAEMAVSRVKGSGPETPDTTPDTENFRVDDFESDQNQYTQRRMSDPSSGVGSMWRVGSLTRKNNMKKSRSETENVDTVGRNGCEEVEADDIKSEFEQGEHYNGFFGSTFGQAWYWFKERRRANSVALHSYLTYVTLPWYRIIADVLDHKQEPILTF